jgi:Flp pilus assembly protein TadD
MKRRHALALALALVAVACRPEKISPPVVSSPSVPELTPEETAERAARRRKAEAARLAKVRRLSADALERGRERLREEQHEEALQAFHEAVRLDRHSAEAWIRIAYVCEQEGDMERASAAFREAKKIWSL